MVRHMHVFNEEDLGGIDILRGISVDAWKPDPHCDRCNACVKKFRTFYRRKHHCRVCGEIYCSKCLQLRYVRIPWLGVALTTVCVWCCDQQAASHHPKSSSSCAFLRLKPLPPPPSPQGSSVTSSSFQHDDFLPLPSKQHKRRSSRRSGGLHIALNSAASRPLSAAKAPPMSPINVPTPAPHPDGQPPPGQLDHTLAMLCSAMQCSSGVIMLRSGTSSLKVLAQCGAPNELTRRDEPGLRSFLAEPRPRCWNPSTNQTLFCATAPLMDAAISERVGCVVVMDDEPRHPGSFDYFRGVMHDHARIIMDQVTQLQYKNLSKKLISIRSRSRNHSSVSSSGGQWV